MRIEILYFEWSKIYWFLLDTKFFIIWIITEKWWSHGDEFVIGIRLGNKVIEKRWGILGCT